MTRGKLRLIAAPFTVAAPSGARIRDRLRVSAVDEKVLILVGGHLGSLARSDLAERVCIGDAAAKHTQRARRKRNLTARCSSRWAGAITRASEDQYRLSLRCLGAPENRSHQGNPRYRTTSGRAMAGSGGGVFAAMRIATSVSVSSVAFRSSRPGLPASGSASANAGDRRECFWVLWHPKTLTGVLPPREGGHRQTCPPASVAASARCDPDTTRGSWRESYRISPVPDDATNNGHSP